MSAVAAPTAADAGCHLCTSTSTKAVGALQTCKRSVMMISSRLLFGARLASRTLAASARAFSDARDSRVMLTLKRGMDIIQDPDLNKVDTTRLCCCFSIMTSHFCASRALDSPKAKKTASVFAASCPPASSTWTCSCSASCSI